VGTPIANRNRAEIEGLIGFFVNTLVLRTDLSGDPTFAELLGRVRARTLDAYAHQDLPFEQLVDELGVVRDRSRTPLFQVLFNYFTDDGTAEETGTDAPRPVLAKFDLRLILSERGDRLAGSVHYSTQLFDEATVRRMIGHLVRLLSGLAGDAGARLSRVDLLSAAETAQARQWNATDAPVPAVAGVHELVARHAGSDSAAVVSEGEAFTFAVVLARANRLARYLRRIGVGPESVVGLAVPRGVDFVVGVLAVWTAGGAYLTLDPAAPAQRSAFMLAEGGVSVLVGSADTVGDLPVGRLRTVLLDDPMVEIELAGLPDTPPAADPAPPARTAYVMFTSGSTGRPKAVQVTHAGLVNYVAGVPDRLGIGAPGASYALLQPPTTDFGNTVVFTALTTGGCLHFLNPASVTDPEAVAGYLAEHRIDYLKVVPSHLAGLADGVALERLIPARALVLGGEATPVDLARRLVAAAGDRVVANHYGPTETTIGVATTRLTDAVLDDTVTPIGAPLPNLRLHVLDRSLRPVPVGVLGDLYVGGAGLARGYRGRPELTAQQFVADPFAGDGSRLYRTGDVVRRRRDGRIAFLGRADDQVKVRGHRIEPAEIQAALLAHPAVAAAIVVADGQAAQRRLVAYLVPADADAGIPAVAELRAFLSARLPEPMIPAVYVEMAAIPLTPNGKLDRAALPGADSARPDLADAYVAPQGPAQQALAEIWAAVLGADRIGIHDNFFELGGHSLLATQVVSRVRAAFEVEVPVAALFDTPTVAGLAAAIDAAAPGVVAPPIVPVGRDGLLPLSFAQQRLWFLAQLEPGSVEYNTPVSMHFSGVLDVDALAGALGALVGRHEVLRTRLVAGEDGVPYQVIDPAPVRFDLPVVDFSGESDPVVAARAWLLVDGRVPFDLAVGPLFRATLLRVSADEHVVALAKHHVVSDEWSAAVLRRELEVLYAGGELPALPVQYADFAVWQRQWLSGAVLEAELGFWREALTGAPVLELPTDRPRPAVRSVDGAVLEFAVPAEVMAGLRRVARDAGASMFMTLLGAFSVLLGRYSGQDDVVVGTPIANRNRAEIEGLIGFFVNTLVLRTDLSGDPTFGELLGRVRERTLAAYAHQDVPFEHLVDALDVHRDRSRSPLFQVLFNYVTGEDGQPAPDEARAVAALYDLTLVVAESADGLAGAVEFATALFDEATMHRLIGHLQLVLAAVAAAPDAALSGLALMSPPEFATPAPVTWDGISGVHELIAGWAESDPSAVAVQAGEVSLTYGELWDRAGRLAGWLRSAGVGAESVVGVAVERGVDLVVAVLGVWRAGGAYLALDPGYPADRLAFMVADAGVGVLVGHRSVAAELAGLVPAVCWLDEPIQAVPVGPVPVVAGQAACVIYTSGSTGVAKAVVVPHAVLLGVLGGWMRAHFGDAERLRWLSVASASFDVFTGDVVRALGSGGTLVLGAVGLQLSVGEWCAVLAGQRVEAMEVAPRYADALVAHLEDTGTVLDGLRLLVVTTDVWRLEAAARARQVLDARVLTAYGVTEAGIDSTFAELGGGVGPAPVGGALPGTRLYVLDAFLRPVPIGVPGELFIGGSGVTRGYLGRAELTASRFVADPFGGGRLYRSGDVVRWRADGTLEFLGRNDAQVKVRGYRIEPGEVEHVLRAHPEVRDAVVVADAGGERLVAYVVPGVVEGLRGWLRERLPEFMVPSVFVELAGLPLTPNGKVDRAGLGGARVALTGGFVAPVGPVQEVLAGIWAELLGVERVGAADDFFDLGGHSLLATQVVSRVRVVFGVEVPVAALFDAPTVAGLAAVVDGAAPGEVAPAIVPVDRDGPLPLSFAQQRLWFLNQLEPDSPEYNTPTAIHLDGEVDVPALATALGGLVARHEVLRTRLVAGEDGVPYQVIDPAPERFDLPVVDLTGEPDPVAAAQAWLDADAVVPFDLATGPLFRVALVRVMPEQHVLSLAMHHVVSDEWSAGILQRELEALYAGAELPALPVQYADFAVWQRRWLTGEVLDRQLRFWRERLDGLPVLELPTDRPRPPLHSSEGAALEFTVPADVANGLRAVAQGAGASMFMTMQSALAVLLGRYSGQDDIVVGAPIANRNRAEIEGLIGFFVNTLVLRTDLSGDPTFAELLGRVRASTLDAYAHQDLPFEQLVDALDVDRDRSRTPLFQVLFNYLTDGGEADPQELLVPRVVPAKFDLSVVLAPSGSGFVGSVKYSTVLFDAERMVRLVGHFVELLSAVAAAPDRPLSLVAVLTGAERRQLERWNDTAAAVPAAGGVHELIGERVAADPHAVAVRCGDVVLTYGELWQRSELLASQLRRLGVASDSVVGLCVGRGVEFVVAVLAVWRAGGAYLPLDPNYPVERLAFMVADGGASVVLGQRPVAAELAAAGVAVTWLEDVPLDGAGAVALPVVLGDQAAYVIYTSGSTGVPKGVVVPHRGVVNLAARLGPLLDAGPGRVVLQFASFGFDAAVLDVATVLCAGGELVVASDVERSDPRVLSRLIRDAGVTSASVAPSLLSQLDPVEVPGVGTWVVGSERVGAGLTGAWAGRSRMFNAYGPTEVSVLATVMPCVAGDAGDPPIGGPLGNVRVRVLDRLLRPVPVGVPGELFIGGVGLARGYAGRAELTAERFVADPFAGDGGRLYRSGDVVRWRADGRLEFVGRADAQVKVRGFRVELGEVEAVLREHPAVDDAVVVADG
ncbi:amino acid adenylation domain-containing protein, partial [Dactylosporangium darangshiense]|uniref:non-ribosomal peptide synthetase n=1 Tax=Dactylosporangium darangshiense TaxID=579108 RepID=UPI0031EFE234